MPEFCYTAVDAQGKPVSGRISATGSEAALRELSADKGLTGVCLAEVVAPAVRQGWLSTEEAVELARGLADLTRSGMPLAAGLRALADELPGFSLKSVLGTMAQQIEAGTPLDEAIKQLGDRLPAHLRGVVLAGLRGGRLAEVLEEYVEIEQARIGLRRRVWVSLAYPLVLLSFLAGLAIFLRFSIAPVVAEVLDDYGMQLPLATKFFLEGIGPLAGLMAGGVILSLAILLGMTSLPTMTWGPRLLYRTPLIGPLWRYGRLAQFARMSGVFLEQEVPLPEALRLVATGLSDAYLAEACYRLAEGVEAGQPLTECMASQRLFPPTMIPLVDWGQRTESLAGAFRAVGDMLEGRVKSLGATLEAVALPIVCVGIFLFVAYFIIALIMPLVNALDTLFWW